MLFLTNTNAKNICEKNNKELKTWLALLVFAELLKIGLKSFLKRFLALTSYQQPETQVNRNYKPPTLQVLIYARFIGSNLARYWEPQKVWK